MHTPMGAKVKPMWTRSGLWQPGVDALLDDIVAGPSPVASPTKANGVSPFEAAV